MAQTCDCKRDDNWFDAQILLILIFTFPCSVKKAKFETLGSICLAFVCGIQREAEVKKAGQVRVGLALMLMDWN